MRRVLAAPSLRILRSSAALFLPLHSLASASNSLPPPPPPLKPSAVLSEDEFAAIRDLVPRLCDGGRHDTAVRLLATALLTDPPPDALPIRALADSLSTLPDMVAAMSLLTALRYHPRRPSPLPFCSALLSSYLDARRPKEAAKVLSWLLRPDSPCRPDAAVYRLAVEGLCRLERMLEALQAVKEMVADGISPGRKVQESVYRGLLQGARVDEATELNAALKKLVEESGEGFDDALRLLDRIIGDWEE